MSVVTVPLTGRMGSRPICASEAILIPPTQTLTLTVMGHLTSCSWTFRANQWQIQGGRQGHVPPLGVQMLPFSCSFWPKKQVGALYGSWRPLRKILDPPLQTGLIPSGGARTQHAAHTGLEDTKNIMFIGPLVTYFLDPLL